MNTKRLITLLLVLVFLTTLLGTSTVASAATAAAQVEIEPNDTIAQATPITLGETMATNNSVDDVDYFRLELTEGQSLYLTAKSCDWYEMQFQLSLHDAAGNLLVEEQSFFQEVFIREYIVPATGMYYIRMTNPDDFEEVIGDYTLFTALNSPGEPFDSPDNATPIAFGEELDSVFDWPNDNDYYEFEGLTGQVADIQLDLAGQEYIDIRIRQPDNPRWGLFHSRMEPGRTTATFVLPFTGRYLIQTWYPDLCERPPDTPRSYHLSLKRMSLYIAGTKNGQVNGVSFGANDILANDATGQWQKVFDGEDVGLTVPLNAFEVMDDGSILLSLKTAQQLGALGKVLPQHIVRFVPTTLGETTAGQFQWYLKGASVGLTTAGEAIDAIALMPSGDLLISTLGAASVPQQGGGTLNSADEDLLRFHPTGAMPSAGTWSMYFDGNLVVKNLGAQNVQAASVVTEDNRTGSWTPDLLITLKNDYRLFNHTAWPTNYIIVPQGNLIGYDTTLDILLPQPERTTFGFRQAITSLSLGPGWGNAPSLGDGKTFKPTDDTFVNSANPTTKYGGNLSLKVKDAAADMNSYLKFNVSGLSGTVQSATLRLYVTDPGPDGGSVYAVSNNYAGGGAWTEGGLTWNNAPAIGGAPLANAGAVSNGKWIELNVTAAITGNGTYSFAIRNANSNVVFYSSKEGANSPQLVITTQ